MSDFKYTKCGSLNAKTGNLSGYANITKPGLSLTSSKIIAIFCGECGHVDSLTVDRPDRF